MPLPSRRSKKIGLKSAKEKAWKAFSRYIRQKYADEGGTVQCCTCGSLHYWKEVDAGHYISRVYLATFLDEMNVHPQCKRCNAQEGEKDDYRKFLVRTYGLEATEALEARKRNAVKLYPTDYLELAESYQSRLRDLQTKEAA